MNPFAQIREPDKTRATLVKAISELNPNSAQWWEYSVSHRRFMLRLYRDGESGDITIGAFGAKNISGPTHWTDPCLSFEHITLPDSAQGTRQWTIIDEKGGFQLTCDCLFWGSNVPWNDFSWFEG